MRHVTSCRKATEVLPKPFTPSTSTLSWRLTDRESHRTKPEAAEARSRGSDMARDDQLRTAIEAWLKAALPALERALGPEPLTWERMSREYGKVTIAIIRPETGMMSLPEADRVRVAAENAFENAQALVGTMIPPDQVVEPSKGGMPSWLIRFVAEYLDSVSNYSFVPDAFEGTYDQLEQYIYDPGSIHFRSTVELWNAQSDVDQIELAPGIVLRPTTDAERRQSEQDSLESDRFSIWSASPPISEVVLELHHRGEDVGERLFPEIAIALSKEIYSAEERLLRGLRLIKPGQVAIGAQVGRSSNPILGGSRTAVPGPDPSWIHSHRSNAYVIDSDIAQQLVDLWPRLKGNPEDPVLSLALRRFEGSYDRATTEDRLIDHWIALEALFIPDGMHELSFRASLRLAWFLAQTREERSTLFDTAKNSYDLRSRVVHGRGLKPKQDLQTITGETESLLRRALRKCLLDGVRPNEKTLQALTLG